MLHPTGSDRSGQPPPEPPGRRGVAVLRFCVSLLPPAILAFLVARFLPRPLSVATDIVGYPIHANFNVYGLFHRYYLAVLVVPACTLAIYHLIGRRWPQSRWPASPVVPEPPALPVPNGAGLVLRQALRALAVGATFGLGWALLDPDGASRFWRDLALGAVAYAVLPIGIAAIAARRAPFAGRFGEVTARLNTLATPFTIGSLYAASRATRVIVEADRSVHLYPWLPLWAACAGVALLVVVTLARLERARDASALRRIEARGILLIAVPVVLWLFTAELTPALSSFDTFHFGEFLVGADLLKNGAFPWRDSIFIHGLFTDVLLPLTGFELFGDTAWGGFAGFNMLGTPTWWVLHYFLVAWLLRGNPALLLAAVAVPLTGAYPYVHWRFAPFPLVLLALAALLERATWLRALALALALLLANVLAPELAYAVPACGAVLLGFELSRRRRDLGLLANLPRTARAAAAGAVLAALWLGYLAWHGAAGAFLGYYATFAPGHELTGGIPVQREVVTTPGPVILMLLPPLLLLLTIWYLVAAVRMRRALDVRDWVAMAMAIVTFFYYGKFLSRADLHVGQAVAPALPLVYHAAQKLSLLLEAKLGRRVALAAGGVVALSLALWAAPRGVLESLGRVPASFSRVVPEHPRVRKVGWSTAELAATGPEWERIGSFLDAYLEPSDALFDFTNNPGLFHYLLGRKPATRYCHVSMAVRRRTQLELIGELEQARPKMVVFYSNRSGLPEWDGVPQTVRHYEISRYLLLHYRPLATLFGHVFFIRGDLPLRPGAPLPGPIDFLSVPEAYARARECDWAYAPRFLRTDWLAEGPTVALDPSRAGPKRLAFDLPDGVPMASVAGLEIGADSTGKGTIAVAAPGARSLDSSQRAEPDLEIASLRLPARSSGAFRLLLDNCPQWYALAGRTLYLRPDENVRVREVRILTRLDAPRPASAGPTPGVERAPRR